jgi:hypothetical protein
MPIASSSYWNNAIARKPGELSNDLEGVRTFETLANNLITLLLQINR